MQIERVSLSPTPLQLKKGAEIAFGVSVEVRGDAGLRYKAKLKIQKRIGSAFFPIWIPVPCISNVGSW